MRAYQSASCFVGGFSSYLVPVLRRSKQIPADIVKAIALMFVSLLFSTASSAAIITYTTSNNGAGNWTYNYTIAATSSDSVVQELTIYFDPLLYADLILDATPIGWDSIVVQPDPGLPANGFVDALSLGAGLSPGDQVSGISVSFSFLGNGMPGAQHFDIVDPTTFATISQGLTRTEAASVPEPGTVWLLLIPAIFLMLPGTRRNPLVLSGKPMATLD
jgi:hypothetical protein